MPFSEFLLTKYKAGIEFHPNLGFQQGTLYLGMGWPMLKRVCVFIGSALFLLLPAAISVFAQIVSGDIAGTVTDPSGAYVAGANVTAVCPDTHLTRTMASGSAGEYRLPDMPSCVYKVSVSTRGFKTTVREVTVTVAQLTKADFRLEVGENSETITVESTSPLVDYSPGINNDVDTDRIVDLPLNGRDFKSVLAITPGVQRIPGGGFLDVSIN